MSCNDLALLGFAQQECFLAQTITDFGQLSQLSSPKKKIKNLKNCSNEGHRLRNLIYAAVYLLLYKF